MRITPRITAHHCVVRVACWLLRRPLPGWAHRALEAVALKSLSRIIDILRKRHGITL